MAMISGNPIHQLSVKWEQYLAATNPKDKENCFNSAVIWLLSSYLSASKTGQQKILEFRSPKEVANVIAQEFLSRTYTQCSDCGDDDQQFGQFLMQGPGMVLLVVLELYSEQVTNCCPEMCNLLFSLFPLTFEGASDEQQSAKKLEVIKLGNIMTSPKPIRALRETLKILLLGTLATENTSEKADDTEMINISDVQTVCDMLEKESFKKSDLMLCLLSSLLGILSSDIIRNGHTLQNEISSKTISMLANREIELAPSQFTFMLSLPLVLLVEVMVTRVNEIVIGSTMFEQLVTFGSSLIALVNAGNKDKYAAICRLSDILIALYSLLYWQICAARSSLSDVILFCRKFASTEIFKITEKFFKKMLIMRCKQTVDIQAKEENIVMKFSITSIYEMGSVFVKISKKLRKLSKTASCIHAPDPGSMSMTKKKHSTSTRRVSSKKEQRSSSDSDKESDIEKHDRKSDSDGSESTGDMSDYILKESESDDARTPVKMKHKRNLSNASVRSKDDELCFFGQIMNILISLYLECDDLKFSKAVLSVIGDIGSCTCIDNDQLLNDLLKRLNVQAVEVASKALDVAASIIEEITPELTNKFNKARHGMFRGRIPSKKRDISPSNKVDNNETIAGAEDLTDAPPRETYQFFETYKSLTSSSNSSYLDLLALHLSKIVPKVSGQMQTELFKKVIFPVFSIHVSVDSSIKMDPSAVHLLDRCLKFLPNFLLNDELLQFFAQKNGISYLQTLGTNDVLAPLAFDSLYQVAIHPSRRIISNHDGKSVRILKDPSPKLKSSFKLSADLPTDSILVKANEALIFCGQKLLEISEANSCNAESNLPETFSWESKSWINFLVLLLKYNELQLRSLSFKEQLVKEKWPRTCFRLLKSCTLKIESSLVNQQETDALIPTLKDCLPVVGALLPICLSFCTEESQELLTYTSMDEILSLVRRSVLHQSVLESSFAKEICQCLFQSSLSPVKKPALLSSKEGDGLRRIRTDTSLGKEDDGSDENMEEEGYEADTESEFESAKPDVACGASGHGSILRNACHPSKHSFEAVQIQNYVDDGIEIHYPEVIILLLQAFNEILPTTLLSERSPGVKETVKILLAEILSSTKTSLRNCNLVSEKGMLKLIIQFLGIFISSKADDSKGILETIGHIAVLLSAFEINAHELREFLQLFKQNDPPMDLLTRILYDMASIANSTSGATFSLLFPIEHDESVQHGKSTSVQQSHMFLIPKRDGSAKNRSILRQRSTTANITATGPKSYGYRCQTASTEIAPVQLPLQESFTWPEMGFSISLWFQINDRRCVKILQDATGGDSYDSFSKSRQHLHQTSFDNEALINEDPIVFHIGSFGGSNALFEIWIGANPRNIEYRWLISDSNEHSGSPSNFDQIILPATVPLNQWNHLIVTLALPSNTAQPHTAMVMTYLNGCEQMPVSMKFPNRAVKKDVKLAMMVGHSIKPKRLATIVESRLTLHIGNVFLFKGNESLHPQRRATMGGNGGQQRRDSIISNTEACYLYALGPDAYHLVHECGERLSSQVSSHMDSSLSWDSVHFKEMSFAMNILSEELVASDFPFGLLVDVKGRLPIIQMSLQDGLILKYSPRRPFEFCQYYSQPCQPSSLPSIMPREEPLSRVPVEISNSSALINGKIRATVRATLQKAVHDSGGMANLIFLFAKVGEDADSELAQSMVLRAIFLIMEKSNYLLRDMNDLAGYVLLHRVLESSPCQLGFHIVKALINSMCDGIVLLEPHDSLGGFLEVVSLSSAIVKNVLVLQALVMDWKIWNDAPIMVQELLWQALQSLVRADHPKLAFNILQFKRARVVEKLLFGLQEREQNNSYVIPATLSKLYIGVITSVLGKPPDMPVLKAICSYLIATHPTVNTLMLHSKSNFYLLPKPPTIQIRPVKANLKPTRARSFRSMNEQKRSHSFTEGLFAEKGSTESIVGIFSNLPSSPEGTGLADNAFPKSEVLFRKEHKEMKRNLFDKIDENRSFALKSNESSGSSDGNLRFGRALQRTIQASDVDELDSNQRPTCSTPVSISKIARENGRGLKIEGKRLDLAPDVSQMLRGNISGFARATVPEASLKAKNFAMLKSHRRNRSLDVNLKFSGSLSTKLDSQEYDIISDSELPSSLDQCSDEYLVVDGFIGPTVGSFTPSATDENLVQDDPLFHVRLGLFETLQEVLTLLPDNLITRIFGTILKVEHLLVLVNQENVKLREIAVKNLSLYLQRGGRDCVNNFKRFKGFHLLANQLHQYPATLDLGNHCLNLMTDRLVAIADSSLKDFTVECPMAMVAYLSLLEDAVQHPSTCHNLITTLLKVLGSADGLMLNAFQQFLPEVICNMISMLATSENGSLVSRWKSSVFKDILDLISWITRKATQTCDPVVFQCFKDLFLAVQMLEAKEREEKASLSTVVVKSARFIQYFMVSSVLKLFRTTGLYLATSRPTSASAQGLSDSRDDGGSTIARRPSRARALFNRLRSSIHVISSPSVASPSEIQERFIYVLHESVILATLFSKPAIICEKTLFGKVLEKLSAVDHGNMNAQGKPDHSSQDADFLFCSDLLSYLLDAVCVCLELKTEDMNWTMLLRGTKEDLVAQTSRLLVYLLSPIRKLEMRFNALQQITKLPESKKVLNTLLHGISGIKNRERLLSCIGSCLKYTKGQLTEDQYRAKDQMKVIVKALKAEIIDVPEQQLFQELREIKTRRQKQLIIQRREAYKRKTDQLNELSSEIAMQGMEVTKNVVEEQDRQRQKLLQLVRGTVSKKVEIKKLWRKIINHLTQERAMWSDQPESCCHSWQLDPTEGPSRVRVRLQRCHTEVPMKFFMSSSKRSKLHQAAQTLSYLFIESCNEDEPTYYTFKTNDTIRFHYHCHRVTPDAKTQGDVLIGETHMYFVGEEILADQNVSQVFVGDKDVISISWRYEEIKEILKRRYALQDNALEIFLTSGRTFLLAFENTKCRNEVFEQLISRELPNLISDALDLDTLTNRWREGTITNFEYLTELNKKAGRSFNDLMQYPVFPFILADYESTILDLNDQASFRDLSKPIAVQHDSKKEKYLQTYHWLEEEYQRRLREDPEEAVPPYHYGSHYSNSGTVLHFLVRLPPFTKMFLMYQDNQFDIPDRTFHSLYTSWFLSSYASSSDVKEMIPEFFFLPEFLQNLEGYDFGCRQNGERVHDVTLPSWTPNNDARLFVNIHRQALESHCVSSSLHNWIDLVFGYKQDGMAAKNSVNVFHPATYFGVDVNAARDAVKRRALQTMIETYGQTPRKLFSSPHVQRFSKSIVSPLSDIIPSFPQAVENLMNPSTAKDHRFNGKIDSTVHDGIQPLPSVIGLSWGRYCGSPSQSDPAMQWVESFEFTPRMIYPSSKSSTAFVVDQNCCLVMPEEDCVDDRRLGCFSWKDDDSFLVVRCLGSKTKMRFDAARPDKITCCSYVPGADLLFIGGSSGIFSAWPVTFNHEPISLSIVGAKQTLLGHSAAITSIFVCRPYSIVVTGSKDSLVIIWDLNRLTYVRCLPKHKSEVTCISVSQTSGNIATACEHGAGGSFVHLWTINAKAIWTTATESKVNCLNFSCAAEGTSVNVVAAGLENGVIRLWSTWTSMCIRDIQPLSGSCPVACLAYSPWDPQHLFSCDSQGNVCLWTRKDLSLKPTFVPVTPM